MKTLKELTIGSVICYNDMANVNVEFVVLEKISNDWGNWVKVLRKSTNTIEQKCENTELNLTNPYPFTSKIRWSIITEA